MITIDQRIKGNKEERAEYIQKLDSIANKAINEKRGLTRTEQTEYDEMQSQVEKINKELAEDEREHAKQMGIAIKKFMNNKTNDRGDQDRTITILKKKEIDNEHPIADWCLRNYDVDEKVQKSRVGDVIAGLATGRVKDDNTRFAVEQVRSISGGSSLLPSYLSAQLWDGAISKSRLAQAGLTIQVMEADSHSFAQVSQYPTTEWKAELASTTDKQATFVSRTLTAKTLRGFVNVSGELMQSGINMPQTMDNVLRTSQGNAIDYAGLMGSGSGAMPQGVAHYSNLNTYSLGSGNGDTITDYSGFAEVLKLIQDDNEDNYTAAIMAPRTAKQINNFQDQNNNPLGVPKFLDGVTFYQTTKVPTDLTVGTASGICSSIIFGDFTKLNLGIRLDTQVIISPVNVSDFSYDCFVVSRADFLPYREQGFGMLAGCKP